MKANYEDKITKQSAEVAMGNLYEMNKQMMMQEPVYGAEELQITLERLRAWFTRNFTHKYFMLLCHELRDYTLFNLDKTDTWQIAPPKTIMSAAADVLDCMANRGAIIAVDQQPDGAWEIWIRNDDGCFAYYLFPYGTAVLEY